MTDTTAELTNQILIDAFSRVGQAVHAAAKDLGEDTLAKRPGEEANPIGWLIWHLARVQDAQIAELKGDEEIWTAHGWYDKFDLPFEPEATGYGHTSEEVSMVRASEALLTGYYDAVQKQTLEYLAGLRPEEYDEIVDPSWDPPVTRAVRLVSIAADDLEHAGQAAYVRGLLQASGSSL